MRLTPLTPHEGCDIRTLIDDHGGENVSATEFEIVIAFVEGVREVAVVGEQHRKLDEMPVVFIIPCSKDDSQLIDRIMTACQKTLAPFKRPHEVVLAESFARAALEKIVKSELRALIVG